VKHRYQPLNNKMTFRFGMSNERRESVKKFLSAICTLHLLFMKVPVGQIPAKNSCRRGISRALPLALGKFPFYTG
jgi:hypothetical protein